MPSLVNLVVFDPAKVDDIIQTWVRAGVSGLTLVDTRGWFLLGGDHAIRDDLPLMPSIRHLLRGEEERSRMIFSVVPDGFDIDLLIDGAQSVLGPLDQPGNGILFVTPVTRVVGLQPPADHPT